AAEPGHRAGRQRIAGAVQLGGWISFLRWRLLRRADDAKERDQDDGRDQTKHDGFLLESGRGEKMLFTVRRPSRGIQRNFGYSKSSATRQEKPGSTSSPESVADS